MILIKVHIFWEGHKICEIFPLLLSYVVSVKSKGKNSQNFVAFSEYMNFKPPKSKTSYFQQFQGRYNQKSHESLRISALILQCRRIWSYMHTHILILVMQFPIVMEECKSRRRSAKVHIGLSIYNLYILHCIVL